MHFKILVTNHQKLQLWSLLSFEKQSDAAHPTTPVDKLPEIGKEKAFYKILNSRNIKIPVQ